MANSQRRGGPRCLIVYSRDNPEKARVIINAEMPLEDFLKLKKLLDDAGVHINESPAQDDC